MNGRSGRIIAGLGAVVLAASLWLDWYGVNYVVPGGSLGTATGTGWELLEGGDIGLALIAVAALACAAAGVWRWGLAVGGAAVVLVIVRMIDTPGGVVLPDYRQDISLEIGIWVALVSALVICAGFGLTAKEESK